MNTGNIPPPPPLPPPPYPPKREESTSELPYLRSHILPPPPPPFHRTPSQVNGLPRPPNDTRPPVPARPPTLVSRPKTSSGVPQEQNRQIPPPPPRIYTTAHEVHPYLDFASPSDQVRQRVHSRALPQPTGVPNAHAPAFPSKPVDGWNSPSYGGVIQHIVGASVRVPVENEAAARMKEEMLARERAIEEDRIRMQAIAAEERRREERRLEEEAARERERQQEEEARLAREREAARERKRRQEEEEARLAREREAARERKRRQEEEEARLAREREAERLRLEAEEAERLRKEVEAHRKAEEEAERKRLEQERKEQWEREERERQERWERDEAERVRWLLIEKQRMEDERLAQMEGMREEMRMELRKQKAELETTAALQRLEAEEAARKRERERERELQEQRDAEFAKRIAEETQDPPSPPAPAPRQAIDGGPVQANPPLPSYEELDSGQLSSPPPIRHSPSPRSRLLPLPPPTMFPAPQLPYHESFQPPPMGNQSGHSPGEDARSPVRRSPMRQPIELHPENPAFRTVSPPINGHVHGSESFSPNHGQHRPPISNPGLTRHTVSIGGANPGRAPPPRIGGFNSHQPHPSPPMQPPRRLTPDEGFPNGVRPVMVTGAPRPAPNAIPNAPSSSAGAPQPLYPSAIQASGSGSGSGPGSAPASRTAHYGDPPPDGVSGILSGYGRPVIQVLPLPAPRAVDPVLLLDPAPGKPFHVVAHTWWHLLRFLASCANTRVEPSPAAMAREKTSPRLRVVLHFVRLPAGDWRIVLYFALDSAEKAPDSYPSWNTTVVPYNFPAPEAGKPMVHTDDTQIYTITMQPLPVLPLALPNLAPYLQAALEESRQVRSSDSRSRLRSLVQASDTSKAVGQLERPGLLSVIGMSSSGSSSSGGSGSGGPPVNMIQEGMGVPSKLARRRDDAGRPGFLTKWLGKTKNQESVNDHVLDWITPFNADEYQ